MSTIDQAFIRAYEPDCDLRSKSAPADHAVATNAEPTDRIDEGSSEGHTSSFYVFAAGSLQLAPRNASTTSQTAVQPEPSSDPVSVESSDVHRPHAPIAQSVAVKQRRPLSDFIQTNPVEGKFRPALEVDQFVWPRVARQLVESGQTDWRTALDALLAAREDGRTLIGVAGAADQCGCTSAIACLAMLLTAEGLKVALVDGNFQRPDLARQLGIGAEIGWEDVLAGRVPLSEAAIHSMAEDALLLPLVGGGTPAAEKLDSPQSAVTAGVLRYHYDLVLFDLGSVSDDRQNDAARRIVRNCRLDGSILALSDLDAEGASCRRLEQLSPELAEVCLGVLQNAA